VETGEPGNLTKEKDMTTTPGQKLWLDRKTRDALREYAWEHRTSMGAVARAAVEDVRNDPENLAAMADVDVPSEVQLTVKMPDSEWTAAREAAATSGHAFNPLVRRRIIKLLTDEGYL
jgi:hypothetical protein